MLDGTYCFAKKGEFVTRTIAGETIVVPVRGRMGDLDSIFNMSDVGSFIWERMDGKSNVRQIVDSICDEFDVARQIAESDVRRFVAALQAAALIEPAPAGPHQEDAHA